MIDFTNIHYQGAETDIPEGSRYATVSETLFKKIIAEFDDLRKENSRLNIELLSDVTLSSWATEHLHEIDSLRAKNLILREALQQSCTCDDWDRANCRDCPACAARGD